MEADSKITYQKLYYFLDSQNLVDASLVGYDTPLAGKKATILKKDLLIPSINQAHLYTKLQSDVKTLIDAVPRNLYRMGNTRLNTLEYRYDLLELNISFVEQIFEKDPNIREKLLLLRNQLRQRLQTLELMQNHVGNTFEWLLIANFVLNKVKTRKDIFNIRGNLIHLLGLDSKHSTDDYKPLPKCTVIGAGPVGLLASIASFATGFDTIILEKRNSDYPRKQILLLEDDLMTALLNWYARETFFQEGYTSLVTMTTIQGFLSIKELERGLSQFVQTFLRIPIYYNHAHQGTTSNGEIEISLSETNATFEKTLEQKLVIVCAGDGPDGNAVRKAFGVKTRKVSKVAHALIGFLAPDNQGFGINPKPFHDKITTEGFRSRGFKNKSRSYVAIAIDEDFYNNWKKGGVLARQTEEEPRTWIIEELLKKYGKEHHDIHGDLLEWNFIEIELVRLETFHKRLRNGSVAVFLGDSAATPHFFSGSGVNTGAATVEELAKLTASYHLNKEFTPGALKEFNDAVELKVEAMQKKSYKYIHKLNSTPIKILFANTLYTMLEKNTKIGLFTKKKTATEFFYGFK